MYDLTGRINNQTFYNHCLVNRLVDRLSKIQSQSQSQSVATPFWIQESRAPEEPVNDSDSVISFYTSVSTASENSVLSAGFASLQRSLESLSHKTESEMTLLREEIGRESSAIFGLIERLQINLEESSALLVDRKSVRNRPSVTPELLSAIPLDQNLPLSSIQEFNFRISVDTLGLLQLRCSGDLVIELELAPDNYFIEGHILHSFIGIEVIITTNPFTSSKRIPQTNTSTGLTFEIYAQSPADGAITLLETMLYPVKHIRWA